VKTEEIRLPDQLEEIAGLIIPGGESTTIGKLAVAYKLMDSLKRFGEMHPIWGTCAGAIFLSKDAKRSQPLLELMDIKVARNAFGRQIASFESDLEIPALEKVEQGNRPYHAIFIRAPLIESVSNGTKVLTSLPDGRIVAAQQGHLLATSFHPELTEDTRFHEYFLSMV
jgi:5'-phosphate synthase pdxT subunit